LLLARYSFKQYTNLRETYLDTIKAFNKLTEAKDTYTGHHASRVESYAVALARYINLPENKIENVRMAALLHDIGKIGISDLVLKKTSALTEEEYEQIKQHPTIGADIIQSVHFLKDVSAIIRHHHERYDGKGYPDHLVGDAITNESAILALADVYDAITSTRSYRNPVTLEEAINEISKNAGTQFNPKLAEKFAELLKKSKGEFGQNDT
jgi:putative nucleotidyltransferase with HDIG domain